MTTAIIGAGLAGLACAKRLAAAGLPVVLFDKGRGPGGRMSTRRVDTSLGELRFDHGAQYFTVRDPLFEAEVARWTAAGACAPWTGRFVSIDADGATQPAPERARYVGTPGMNGPIKHLAEGLDVAWGRRASGVAGAPKAWRIAFEGGGEEGPFEHVVFATPAEQTPALAAKASSVIVKEARAADTRPCWTLMAAFDAPLPAPFDGAAFKDHRILGWAARNASKPGRGPGEAWVVQAHRVWSRAHEEDAPEQVADALLKAFSEAVGAPAPVHAEAHRWRYAFVEKPAGSPLLWSARDGLGACGDWRLGPRVEFAWLSGHALGDAVAETAAKP